MSELEHEPGYLPHSDPPPIAPVTPMEPEPAVFESAEHEHSSDLDDLPEPPDEVELPRDGLRPYERLSPEAKRVWDATIEDKLAANVEANVPGAQIEAVRTHLENIAANMHLKFGEAKAAVPEMAQDLFNGLVHEVMIFQKDCIRKDTGHKYIATAHAATGTISIFPEFFRVRGEKEPQIDQAHVLAHEFGEMAYTFFNAAELMPEYDRCKLKDEWARDGDYVNSEASEHKSREEFAETFGDWLTSSSNVEMLQRRIERYDDKTEFFEMAKTEEGRAFLDQLLGQSVFQRAFLANAMERLAPQLKAAAEAYESTRMPDDLDFDLETVGVMDDRASQLHSRESKPNLLIRFWKTLTGADMKTSRTN